MKVMEKQKHLEPKFSESFNDLALYLAEMRVSKYFLFRLIFFVFRKLCLVITFQKSVRSAIHLGQGLVVATMIQFQIILLVQMGY